MGRILQEVVGDAGVKTAVTAKPAIQILGTPIGDEPTASDTEANEMEGHQGQPDGGVTLRS